MSTDPLKGLQNAGYAPAPVAKKGTVKLGGVQGKGGAITPYYSPANPRLGKPPSIKALPPAGGSTPRYGVGSRGPELNIDVKSPNPRFDGGGRPPVNLKPPSKTPGFNVKPLPRPGSGGKSGGGLSTALLVAQTAVGGIKIGNAIYEGAGDINSNVFKVIDRTPFERALREFIQRNKDKYARKPKSGGGGLIQEPVYPWRGGGRYTPYDVKIRYQQQEWKSTVEGLTNNRTFTEPATNAPILDKTFTTSSSGNYKIQPAGTEISMGYSNYTYRVKYTKTDQSGNTIEGNWLLVYDGQISSGTVSRVLNHSVEFLPKDNQPDVDPPPSVAETREPVWIGQVSPKPDQPPKPFAEPPPSIRMTVKSITLLPPPETKPSPQNFPPKPAPKPDPRTGAAPGTGTGASTGTRTSSGTTTKPKPETPPKAQTTPQGTKANQTPKGTGGTEGSGSLLNPTRPISPSLPIPPIPAPVSVSPPTKPGDTTIKAGEPVKEPEPERQPNQNPNGGCCIPTPVLNGQNQILQGQNTILDKLNAGGQAVDLALLTTINNKLGDQVPGGLSGWLGKFSNSLKLDRAMNAINFMLNLHNAMMLSRSIGESMSELINTTLQALNLKDENDEEININAMIGGSIDSLLTTILGAEAYTGLKRNWKFYSTIYTSAAQIKSSMENIFQGFAEGLNTLGEMEGKIGNALRKSGVVLENSYEWFSEKFSFRSGRLGKWQNVMDGLQTVEEITENLAEVSSAVVEIQEEYGNIQTEINKIKLEIATKQAEKTTSETASKEASKSPNIEKSDLIKVES